MANPHLDTPWTWDKVQELRRLWSLGYSASEIARTLGVSRSSTLGKLHRLQLQRFKSEDHDAARRDTALRSSPHRDASRRDSTPRAAAPRIALHRSATSNVPMLRRAVFIAPTPKAEPETVRERAIPDGFPAKPPEPQPRMRRLQLVQLNDDHCRWPIGDPRLRPFYFCAADKMDGSSYCAYHDRKSRVRPK